MIPDIAIPSSVHSPWFRLKPWLTRILRMAVSDSSCDPCDDVSLEQEFIDLVTRENATISKICFSYAGSTADYEDLRQDALINIWRGLKSFRREALHRTWIYRVTVNSCLSTLRRQNRHKHESLDQLYGLIDDGDENRESIEQMHRIIGILGRQEQAIIMMWLDEMSYEEIASAMGIPRNTVASKIHRIKEKIATIYNKEETL